jgi:predicted RNA-binding Zn-ribbon protein involved in translation (DUF1610 family)
MDNQFSVNCPNCGVYNDFSDDHWNDALIDTSDYTYTNCLHCNEEMIIETTATYKFKILDYE